MWSSDQLTILATRREPGLHVLTFIGELDRSGADAARALLMAAITEAGTERVRLDLAGLTFMDAAGVRAIAAAQLQAAACDVDLRLEVGDAPVGRALEASGLLHLARRYAQDL